MTKTKKKMMKFEKRMDHQTKHECRNSTDFFFVWSFDLPNVRKL